MRQLILLTILLKALNASAILVPEDFVSIQAALDSCATGDTVLVSQGIYYETIWWPNTQSIKLLGSSQESCIISSMANSPFLVTTEGIRFPSSSGCDTTTVVSGFTIQSCRSSEGGGISIEGCSPTLKNLTIKDNESGFFMHPGEGGGIYIDNGSPILSNLKVYDNRARYGGGIFIEGGSPIIRNCEVYDNQASYWGGGLGLLHGSVIIRNSMIYQNIGEGMTLSDGDALLENVTIHSNTVTGLEIYDCHLVFSSENRCNIYFNGLSGNGREIILGNNSTFPHIVLDTFTVLIPTNEYINPVNNCTYDILHLQDNFDQAPEIDARALGTRPASAFPYRIALEDINLTGPDAGVQTAAFHWESMNAEGISTGEGAEEFDLVSGSITNGIWECTVPELPTGSDVEWYVTATDVNGNSSVTPPSFFNIFSQSGDIMFFQEITPYYDRALVDSVYNKFTNDNTLFQADRWLLHMADTLTYEIGSILDQYSVILEFTNYAVNPFREEISAWLDQPDRGYILTGCDEVGTEFGYEDQDFLPGDYWYDLFGIASLSNDILFDGWAQLILSRIMAVQVDTLSGYLFDYLSSQDMSLNWYPEIATNNCNFMDWMIPTDDTEVAFTTFDEPIVSPGDPDPTGGLNPCALYKELPSGSRTAILGFDPSTLWAENADTSIWINGIDSLSILKRVIDWAGRRNPTSVENDHNIPQQCRLYQNYPNPFNPTTTISYSLPEAGEVELLIYDIRGRLVDRIFSGPQSAGVHDIQWNGLDQNGIPICTGVYLCKLLAGEYSKTIKMLYLK